MSTGTDHHPGFARIWPTLSRQLERAGATSHREWLLGGLSGRVLEIGAGTGPNFGHYPSTVDDVIAVEPEPRLRAHAERAAARAAVPIEVRDGLAQDLPLDDDSVDAVVVTLVLCSVPDQPTALAEIRRVLRPGGRLRFFEHVAAQRPAHLRLQRALDATFWPRIGGNCHMARDTAAAIATAGLQITEIERLRFPGGAMPAPTSPHVRGEAVEPV